MLGNACAKILVRFLVALRNLAVPTLTSYFFWSSVIYLAAGVYSMVIMTSVKKKLCGANGEKLEAAQCTDCKVHTFLQILAIVYFIQFAAAFLVFLSFLYFSKKDADDLASLSCLTKVLGFFCKMCPLAIRLLTMMMFFLVAPFGILAVRLSFIPTLTKCKDEVLVESAAIVTICVYAFQLIFGFFAVKAVKPSPWFYAPMKPGKGLRYQLVRLLRLMGP